MSRFCLARQTSCWAIMVCIVRLGLTTRDIVSRVFRDKLSAPPIAGDGSETGQLKFSFVTRRVSAALATTSGSVSTDDNLARLFGGRVRIEVFTMIATFHIQPPGKKAGTLKRKKYRTGFSLV